MPFINLQELLDLSKQIGKEIDLIIEGGETELDKTLVEEIADPLVHLIRNSVDHGIELPSDREKLGKLRKGTIKLSAFQDGNMIVIAIQDDGKGLQTEKIFKKAKESGLISETEEYTDKEIYNLIFEPGFSTADAVTNISGRGVGMDVVKKNILKLKGIIELDSKLGEGTKTIIRLPLTLAIIPSLMVKTKDESFAIPLVNVVETMRIEAKNIQKIGGGEFLQLRDSVLPLFKLNEVLGLHNKTEKVWYSQNSTQKQRDIRTASPRIVFVVVGIGEQRFGLIVDSLLGQQEIVIKPLGKLLGKREGVSGGCVLGDGTVALVLDVGEVSGLISQKRKHMVEVKRSAS
jgi:two-component system, chemotaxis family, sensor kinase CheA